MNESLKSDKLHVGKEQCWEKTVKPVHGTSAVRCIAASAVFAVICISITMLVVWQEHQNRQLRQDVEELKANMAKCLELVENNQRVKRADEDEHRKLFMSTESPHVRREHHGTESAHVKREHHGIHSSKIALLVGDSDKLEEHLTSRFDYDELAFYKSTLRSRPSFCAVMYRNNFGQGGLWCPPIGKAKGLGADSLFSVVKGMPNFDYFKESSWMNTKHSLSKYEIGARGRIRVQTQGMYIVFANILFRQDTSPTMSYRIKVERNRRTFPIGQCTQTVAEDKAEREYGLTPCSVMVVVPLSANDEVILDIKEYIFFKVSPDTLQFGMIKLSDTNF